MNNILTLKVCALIVFTLGGVLSGSSTTFAAGQTKHAVFSGLGDVETSFRRMAFIGSANVIAHEVKGAIRGGLLFTFELSDGVTNVEISADFTDPAVEVLSWRDNQQLVLTGPMNITISNIEGVVCSQQLLYLRNGAPSFLTMFVITEGAPTDLRLEIRKRDGLIRIGTCTHPELEELSGVLRLTPPTSQGRRLVIFGNGKVQT